MKTNKHRLLQILCSFGLASIVFLFASACEPLQDSVRPVDGKGGELGIVNGTDTGYKTWKGVLALVYTDSKKVATCTATLIDRQVVITAAHCVMDTDLKIDAVSEPRFLYFLGGSNIFSTADRVVYMGGKTVVVHPDWPGRNLPVVPRADIALVKLEGKMPNTVEEYGIRGFPPIEKGEVAKIVGYGKVSTQGESGIHRVGDSAVLDLNKDVFESGSPSGACMGDSGGPVFTDRDSDDLWDLSGVISFSTTAECEADRDTWSVNLGMYYGWIDQTMKELVGHGLPPLDTDPEEDAGANDAGADDAGADDAGTGDAGGDAGGAGDGGDGCGCSAAGAVGANRLVLLMASAI